MHTQYTHSDPFVEAARRAMAARRFDAAAYVQAIRDAGCTPQICGDWFGIGLGDGMSMLRLERSLEDHESARHADPDWKAKIRTVLEGEAA